MLTFKTLEISDKRWIDKILRAENSRSADYSFGTMFMWDQTFRQRVAPIGDRLGINPTYTSPHFFAFPVGTGDLETAIRELREYAISHEWPLRIRGVTTEHRQALEDLFPGRFEFRVERDQFDYIYAAEKLASLSGKKLHGKRNHINRFLQTYDWSFEPLTPALIPVCMDMLHVWIQENSAKVGYGLGAEHNAIVRGFSHFEDLGLEGGVLRVNGKVVAFTMGEQISADTFDVHFEKALTEIEGAYPMVNREFVRLILERHPNIQYINREDDMGIENLRTAKLSYYPEFLVEKHTAFWRQD